MKLMRTVFTGTCVVAACLAGPAAPARAPAAQPGIVVRTLPLDAAPRAAQESRVAAPSSTAECLDLPRATEDRPDFDSGHQVHVIYMLPSGERDERLDTDGTLECSLRAQNQWMAEQTRGLEWRLDTFLMEAVVDGRSQTLAVPDITFVQSPQRASDLDNAGSVSRELRARGFDDRDKRYLTYVAAGDGSVCGDAYYPYPKVHEPWSGKYAQVYLNATRGCGTNVFGVPGEPSLSESVAQQELIHNDGMTPIGAPHSCLLGVPPGMAHVCTGPLAITNLDPERFDVMFPFAGVPLSEKTLDRGNDDYFRHGLPITDFADTPFLRPMSERPVPPAEGASAAIEVRVTRG